MMRTTEELHSPLEVSGLLHIAQELWLDGFRGRHGPQQESSRLCGAPPQLRAAHIAVGVLCVLHKAANCSLDHLREKDTSALAAIQASATAKIVKVVASFLASIQKVESNALVKL
jgi:hypothetical protein